jgi:hypothetical protein
MVNDLLGVSSEMEVAGSGSQETKGSSNRKSAGSSSQEDKSSPSGAGAEGSSNPPPSASSEKHSEEPIEEDEGNKQKRAWKVTGPSLMMMTGLGCRGSKKQVSLGMQRNRLLRRPERLETVPLSGHPSAFNL